jgi:hypothetical protein
MYERSEIFAFVWNTLETGLTIYYSQPLPAVIYTSSVLLSLFQNVFCATVRTGKWKRKNNKYDWL